MTWIIVMTILSFIITLYIFRKGRKDKGIDTDLIWHAETSGLHSKKKLITIDQLIPEGPIKDNDPMFQENDIDEFDPDSIISDETLKSAILRTKLNKIEQEIFRPDIPPDSSGEDEK